MGIKNAMTAFNKEELYAEKPVHVDTNSILSPCEKMFIEEVKEEIFNQRLAHKDIAIKAGVSEALISSWVTGVRHVTIKSALKIAEALGFKLVICLVEKD